MIASYLLLISYIYIGALLLIMSIGHRIGHFNIEK